MHDLDTTGDGYPVAETMTGSRVVHVMGTVVSFDLRDQVSAEAFDEAVAFLNTTDRIFSTYRSDSEISRLQRDEITIEDCHPDVGEVLQKCRDATVRTRGFFSAYPYGRLDPTGLVKGWAIERTSQILSGAGSRRHSVNGGGDIQLANDPTAEPWRVGIADPADRSTLVAVAILQGGAIATSGSAERGHHIVDPHTALAAQHFTSVTITAPSLVDADVFATAAFARGKGAIEWIESLHSLEGLFVDRDGVVTATRGFPGSQASLTERL